jgi:hypothetical protein
MLQTRYIYEFLNGCFLIHDIRTGARVSLVSPRLRFQTLILQVLGEPHFCGAVVFLVGDFALLGELAQKVSHIIPLL